MKKLILILLILTSCSSLRQKKAIDQIENKYLKIEKSTDLETTNYELIKGVDISKSEEGSLTIYSKNSKVVKIERNLTGYGFQNTVSIYFNNEIPIFIIENRKGEIVDYLTNGEIEHYEESYILKKYIFDWKNSVVETTSTENERTTNTTFPFCKPCYEKIIKIAQNQMTK
ncbi:hypothetical protein [Owenweeksia hongkongensis]|uniref:hypothetical protein n=1 Tax=Owenweeksia hongkongensis TaxID=253245 RepID=UPI003A8EE059